MLSIYISTVLKLVNTYIRINKITVITPYYKRVLHRVIVKYTNTLELNPSTKQLVIKKVQEKIVSQ